MDKIASEWEFGCSPYPAHLHPNKNIWRHCHPPARAYSQSMILLEKSFERKLSPQKEGGPKNDQRHVQIVRYVQFGMCLSLKLRCSQTVERIWSTSEATAWPCWHFVKPIKEKYNNPSFSHKTVSPSNLCIITATLSCQGGSQNWQNCPQTNAQLTKEVPLKKLSIAYASLTVVSSQAKIMRYWYCVALSMKLVRLSELPKL